MKIIWTELALFANSPNAAVKTIDRIERSLEALQAFPKMGRLGRVSGTRELVIPENPFMLPYRIQANHIEILAVLHGAQQWDDRF
jgi:toxin ParE1/3/4